MADKAVTCPFAEPHNGAVVLMKAANLTLDEGASIDASEKGWYMGEGPGISVDKYNLMGSSYGGEGGCADKDGKIPPPTYGSRRNPVDPGSGGEHSTYPHSGCDGGGVVLLNVARTFVFNGLVTADGNTMFVSTYARGSSGGTVNIVAGKILGSSGRIRAQGGFSHQTGRSSYGSVGGGGRVAVRYSSTTWTKEMMDAATCVLPGGAYGEEDNHFGATEGTSFWKPLDGLMLFVR